MSTNTPPEHPTPSMFISALYEAGIYIRSDDLDRVLEIAKGKAKERHERIEAIRRKYAGRVEA